MVMNKRSLILFSGGIDSTTALYWAKKEFDYVLAVIIDYSQKHNIEAEFAKRICEMNSIPYKHVKFSLKNLFNSALLNDERSIPDSLESSKDNNGIPFTYVPFRNGLFLSLAAGIAESENIRNIITGFNLIDTPDYPDTTENFTKKMEAAINEGTSASITGNKFSIKTPLIKLKKYEIIQMGLELAADYSYSISCYRGEEIPCMKCPSCDIRNRAFEKIGIRDPLIVRLKKEGKYEKDSDS